MMEGARHRGRPTPEIPSQRQMGASEVNSGEKLTLGGSAGAGEAARRWADRECMPLCSEHRRGRDRRREAIARTRNTMPMETHTEARARLEAVSGDIRMLRIDDLKER